ncbi:MAG: hypothetical protein AAF840_10745 [Bacteroidota bacterium]
MAKKDQLNSSFGANRRRKKPSLDEIEKIAEQVPATNSAPKPKPAAKPRKPVKPKAPKPAPTAAKPILKKTSVDLPLDLYQDLKIHLIKRQMKFREYLIGLIEQDLGR